MRTERRMAQKNFPRRLEKGLFLLKNGFTANKLTKNNVNPTINGRICPCSGRTVPWIGFLMREIQEEYSGGQTDG